MKIFYIFAMLKTLIKRAAGGLVQRAVSCKRGCIPAESFVRIWKFVARPNLCGTPLREAAIPLSASGRQRSGTMTTKQKIE